MRAWRLQDTFGLNSLQTAELEAPRPGDREVTVAVSAVSLNYRDLLMVTGRYNPRQPLPLIPCSDGVGRVSAVGAGVTSLEVGDRVAGIFCQKWLDGPPTRAKIRATLGGPIDGMLATHRVLPETGLVRVPEHLSDAEAATLPCAGLTAWSALFDEGGLEPGQCVLLQGTGGVSIYALQLAKAAGARVVITSSSDEKLERARELGADHTINYRADESWGKSARALTGGEGVDLVVEVGGAGTLKQSLRAVRVNGRVCQIGILAGGRGEVDLTSILMSNIRVQGVLVGSRARFERMNRAIAQSGLRPVVDRVFPFAEAVDAFAYLESGSHFGKVVISTS